MTFMVEMMTQMMGGKKKGAGGRKSGKSNGPWKHNYKIDESGGVLGEFSGKIKSLNWKNSYGFIVSEECQQHGHDGDIFVHWDQFKGFKVGQTIKFTAFLTEGGKAQAKDLKL